MKNATIPVSSSTKNMQQMLQYGQRWLNKGKRSRYSWQRHKNKHKQESVHHPLLLHPVLVHAAARSTATISILETVVLSAFAAGSA